MAQKLKDREEELSALQLQLADEASRRDQASSRISIVESIIENLNQQLLTTEVRINASL